MLRNIMYASISVAMIAWAINSLVTAYTDIYMAFGVSYEHESIVYE